MEPNKTDYKYIPISAQSKIAFLVENGAIEEAQQLESLYRKEGKLSKASGSVHTELTLKKFITANEAMLRVKQECRILAGVDDSVLITGESGTGKELLAQALHGHRDGRFIAINCTALPDYLLESELFGHIRGAFTGAVNDKVGLFQAAHKGTIFMDEIGDMPEILQAKLLRVLQDKKARRVGDTTDYDITARFIFATNRTDLISEKKFRDDLFWRISVCELHLTPLVLRMEDVPLIVESLDAKFPKDFQWQVKHLAGNVRSIQKGVRQWQLFKRLPTI